MKLAISTTVMSWLLEALTYPKLTWLPPFGNYGALVLNYLFQCIDKPARGGSDTLSTLDPIFSNDLNISDQYYKSNHSVSHFLGPWYAELPEK